ncbi:hypothetical protein Moror_13429 [Moniliophthora roreri MCA 2997]|uniref:Uncharacterized protein n=1 Tax=Moniliophthora roreri (strain MCA 2997) TaxID=1381753 RepID=V2WP91_MONRO|nr:hypothetical protein Moror_13429 [Moniliophthora roreri MCA 2997]
MTATNLQLNRLTIDIAAMGFTIPGQLTVPMICAPEIFPPHPFSRSDYATAAGGETSPTGGLEYPPRSPTEALEDYELTDSIVQNHLRVPSPDLPQSPPPQPERQRPQNLSPETSDSELNLPQRSNRSLSPEPSSTEPLPHPLVSLSQSLQTAIPRTPGPPGIGTPQLTPGTPPPGLSVQSPLNEPSLPENNADAATTEPKSQPSFSPPSPISIPEFINAINAISGVIIHRTVETTSVQSATHTNLTISLSIAHNYKEVNKFLSHGLLGVIQLLMALRRTTLIRPPSPTSPTSPISIEEEEAPPVYTIVRITDNREPITLTTDDGEERTFLPVRYVNGATVFEAGTSNQNRG